MKNKMIALLLTAMLIATSGCGKTSKDSAGIKDAENNTETSLAEQKAPGKEQNASGKEQDAPEEKQSVTVTELPLNIIGDKYRTTYEVFVYSFCDSNGDGIGDLKGLISRLDYINDGDDTTDTDLGCNEIWLMPICPSPTYHKYDVTDYMAVDEQYGTMEDFDELVKECHDRGVNVITDLVLNHTSTEHPWFVEAAQYLRENPEAVKDSGNTDTSVPYLQYYRFATEKSEGYEPLPDTDLFYEARFWSGMPDLNLDSELVKGEIADITQFWIDHGVDGFRLDAVTSYYTGNDQMNTKFLTWLNDTVKSQKSDAYIVGEAWTNSATYHKYYASGIDSFFDFDFSGGEGIIAATVKGSSPASRFGKALMTTESALAQAHENAIDAPFYTNHDMARSCGYYVGKTAEDRVKMAGALNLLMGGNAFIYYGEELGMKGSGKDENKRAPMYWSDDRSAEGMCRGPKDMDSFKMKYPSYEEQEKDPYSIYNYYKSAIRLRNTFPVIARGKTGVIEDVSNDDICAFIRSADDYEDVLVVFNTSEEPVTVSLASSQDASGYENLVYQLNTREDEVSISGGELVLPAYSIAVLVREL